MTAMSPVFASRGSAQLVLGGGSLLQRAAKELTTVLERALTPYDVTAQQAALLLRLRTESVPSRLAAALGTDTAGMTRLLDRLEDKGLVRRTRHPSDRRSVHVELTDTGATLTPRLAPVFGTVVRRSFDGFSCEELELLTSLMGRILKNLGSGDA